MNPIKFIIDDLKKDAQKIRDIKEGRAKLVSFKNLDFSGALKDYWPWFLLLIAAFLAGFFFGSVLAHNDCVATIKEVCPEKFIYNESIVEYTKIDLDLQKRGTLHEINKLKEIQIINE